MSEIYLNDEESIRCEHEIISKFLQKTNFVQVIEREPNRSDTRKKDAAELVKRLYKSPEESLNSFCIDMGFNNPKGSKIIGQLNRLLSKFSKQYHIFPHIQVFPLSRISKNILCHFACAEHKEKLSNKTYPIDIVTLKEAKARGKRESQADLSDLHIEQFCNKLKEEAQIHLKEKLHGKELDDYKSLGLEIGLLEESRRERNDLHPDPTTHNRVWQEFDHKELEDPKGIYILSSETGSGKTTFLRHLQLAIIENTDLIPLFIEASDLEKLDFRNRNPNSFLTGVAKLFSGYLQGGCEQLFLNEYLDQIIFVVDGLDQITGSGTQYENLIDKLLGVVEDKLIITSRPFAVMRKERDPKIKFLKLKSFTEADIQAYFGDKCDRAKDLCRTCPEMLCVPMSAYMIRVLIEEGRDTNIKNRADLYKEFIDYIFEEYSHDNLDISEEEAFHIRKAYGEISFKAIANDTPYLQTIPFSFAIDCKETDIEIDDLFKYGIAHTIINRTQAIKRSIYFSHHSFQEYLAAEYMSQDDDRIQQVLYEKWNPKWKEVVKFLAGLLGENFVRKIYSDNNDNRIHSGLFLAADCCGEIGEVTSAELQVFEKLKSIINVSAFKFSAIDALSKLNTPKAIDFLIELLPRSLFYAKGPYHVWSSELIKTLINISDRLKTSHIDRIVTLFRDVSEFHCQQIIVLLGKLSRKISPEQIDKIIDITFRDSILEDADLFLEDRELLRFITMSEFNDGVLKQCSIKIAEFLNSSNEHKQMFALELICELADIIEITDGHLNLIYNLLGISDDINEAVGVTLRNICLKLSPKHINKLFGHFKNCNIDLVRSEVFTGLAELGELEEHYIEKTFLYLKKKNISLILIRPLLLCKLSQRQEKILLEFVKSLDKNATVDLFDKLKKDISKGSSVALKLLANYISASQIELQYICFDILCDLCDSISPDILEKRFDINTILGLLGISKTLTQFYTLGNLAGLHKWMKDGRASFDLEYDFSDQFLSKPLKPSKVKMIISLIRNPSKPLSTKDNLVDSDLNCLNTNAVLDSDILYLQGPPNKYVQINSLKILTYIKKQNLKPYIKEIIDLLECDDDRVIVGVSSILSQLKYLSDTDMIRIIESITQLAVSYPYLAEHINESLIQMLFQRGYLPTILACFRADNADSQDNEITILRKGVKRLGEKQLELIVCHLIEHYSLHSIVSFLYDFKQIPLGCFIRLLDHFGNIHIDCTCEGVGELSETLHRLRPLDLPDTYLASAKKEAINNIKCNDQNVKERSVYYLSLLSDKLTQEELKTLLEACLNEDIYVDIYPPPENKCLESIVFLLDSLESKNKEICQLSIYLLYFFHSKLETKHVDQVVLACNHSLSYVSRRAYELLKKRHSEGEMS